MLGLDSTAAQRGGTGSLSALRRVLPCPLGGKPDHRKNRRLPRLREWCVTGASSTADEGLCSRRGGTDSPTAGGRRQMLSAGAVLASGN